MNVHRLVGARVEIMYTFSMSGEVEEFRAEGGRNIPSHLRGPGILFLHNNARAFFQDFLVDVSVSY